MNYVSTPVGYSMVKKGPLDKHMKFASVQDMMNYVFNGPVFEGQFLSCDLSNGKSQPFVIRGGHPFPIFNNMELITTVENGETYVLLSANNTTTYNTKDPFNFNINEIKETVDQTSEDIEKIKETIDETSENKEKQKEKTDETQKEKVESLGFKKVK